MATKRTGLKDITWLSISVIAMIVILVGWMLWTWLAY